MIVVDCPLCDRETPFTDEDGFTCEACGIYLELAPEPVALAEAA